jgi:OmpA-OmpF porin, OOP family
MTKPNYALPLLLAGAVGLAVTCFAAPSLERPAVATAISLPEPKPAPVVEPEPAPVAVAAAPAPAVVRTPEAEAGRAQACQAEFDKVSQANRIDFGRDRYDLSPKAKAAVDKFLIVARACSGLKIEVGGHTDSQGKRRNNVNLSKKRADAVRDYLVELGLSPDLLTAVGFGPDRPVASNRTSSGRDRNRRIEFRVSRVE